MTTSNRESGRSAVRRGIAWQREVTRAVLPLGFPYADHVGTGGPHATGRGGDLTGVGDRVIECTVQPMDKLAGKLRQAESDAIRAGFTEYYVVKKAVREAPSRAYVVTRLEVLMPLLARLDQMDWLEAKLDEAYAELRGSVRDGVD